MEHGSTIKNETNYVIGVTREGLYSATFKMLYPSTVVPEITGGWGTYSSKDISGGLEITLQGMDYGNGVVGGLSEAVIKFKGTGAITIESDVKLGDGTLLKNSLILSD